MLNESEYVQIEKNTNEDDLNDKIDNQVGLIPLDEQEQQIIQEIIKAPTQQELQAQFDAFNMNQSKKNALRIIKLNSLLDKVEDQAIERFEKRPDQVSNKEILEYMQVVSNQIDRSQKFIETLKDKPMIKINEKHSEVNINIGTDLDRDSKERVIDAIQALLKQVQKPETEIVDVDLSEETTEDEKMDEIDTSTTVENKEEGNDCTEGEN